jgi:cytochrome c oxidase assembly protein subunit 15
VNTQLLLAALTLTAWFAGYPRSERRTGTITAALPIALLVGVTGAIAALGDTLFPATSFTAGWQQDMSSTAHFLLRLRILHPFVAVGAGVFFGLTAMTVVRSSTSLEAKRAAWIVALLVVVQLYAGTINVLLLAPVWLQMVHLLLANCLWIALVVLSYSEELEAFSHRRMSLERSPAPGLLSDLN